MELFNFETGLKKINYIRHRYLKLVGKSKNPGIHKFVAEYKKDQWEDVDFMMNLLINKINMLINDIKNKNNEINEDNRDDMRGNKVLRKFFPLMMAYYMVLQQNEDQAEDQTEDQSEDLMELD